MGILFRTLLKEPARRLFSAPLLAEPRAASPGFSSKREFIDYVHGSVGLIDKAALITSLCRDREVLDLGCIDHSYEVALSLGDKWLHKQLKQVSKSLVGLDILKEDAQRLGREGYNIIVADAESFDLGRKFDVIVVGDLIEHLSNIGSFLDAVRKHMHGDSIAVITTPNPFNIEQTMLGLFQGAIAVNDQHTVWLDPRVMYELINRYALRIVDFYWVDTRFKLRVQRKIVRYLANAASEVVMRFRPLFRRDYAVIVRPA